MPAFPPHSTGTDTDSTWDASNIVAESREALRYVHAGIRPNTDPELKGSYVLPHHYRQGGPAIIRGVNNALARLPQTDVDDKPGLERHLRAHRRAAGLEEESARPHTYLAQLAAFPVRQQADGREEVELCVVTPGWVESLAPLDEGEGTLYYSEQVLQDAASRIAPGMLTFWDHPNRSMAEGSLANLAGVVTSPGAYRDGFNGPGIYASARVYPDFVGPLKKMGDDIGVSVRWYVEGEGGRQDGRNGVLVTDVLSALSVDYVTIPGRGGKVRAVFENAKMEKIGNLVVASAGMTQDRPDPQLDLKPASESASTSEASEELVALQERIKSLENLTVRQAAEIRARELLASTELPNVAQGRLIPQLASNAPVKGGALDEEAFAAVVQTAAEDMANFLKAATTPKGVELAEPVSYKAPTTELFQSIGLSRAAAEIAAKGGL